MNSQQRCYVKLAPNRRHYVELAMLLITGERRFADLIERTLYNGFLSGVSLDGRCYFYVNPLMCRGSEPLLGRKHIVRPEWHGCACCPPNVMRLLASLQHYLATGDDRRPLDPSVCAAPRSAPRRAMQRWLCACRPTSPGMAQSS